MEIDFTRPLLHGISVRIYDENIWIPFTYESLPTPCFGCGIIDHFIENCSSIDRDNTEALSTPKLCASQARNPRNHKPEVVILKQDAILDTRNLLNQPSINNIPTINNPPLTTLSTNPNPKTTQTLTYYPENVSTERVFASIRDTLSISEKNSIQSKEPVPTHADTISPKISLITMLENHNQNINQNLTSSIPDNLTQPLLTTIKTDIHPETVSTEIPSSSIPKKKAWKHLALNPSIHMSDSTLGLATVGKRRLALVDEDEELSEKE